MSLEYTQYRPHPWHGLDLRPDANEEMIVNAYIEMTPFDSVKYEIDKKTGYLFLDRPQRYSSQLPALYGFIPKTYCGEEVRALCPEASEGDGDPLDICILCERPVQRGELLVHARVLGGLPMIDGGEADDKIVAVLPNDPIWEGVRDISELPVALIDRIRHYFLTYKLKPGMTEPPATIGATYDAAHALKVVEASSRDYQTLLAKG